jgi:WD40 repeat protein/tRNA A-37 threonylcarbamoyl transferase component Bud32
MELLSGQANARPKSCATDEGTSQSALDVVPAAQKIRRFGDYELLGQIAEGGMGIVYFARQISLSRTVALKMIRSGQLATDAEIHRFRTEAEAAATLDHPNIVPIYEIGDHEGQQYFSMKLVEGGTLADLNAAQHDRNPAWQRRAAELMARVAIAVHHAHQRGVLHRDLKPTNVLLDEQGEPHLTDFGLAKVLEGRPDFTQSLAILGTPGYMAPEQAAGRVKQLTTAADIYSLGAILYELLVGRQVCPGESTLEILKQVQENEPASPRKLNPAVAPDLETICLKCLQKAPDRRYTSAQSFAEDIERFLRGEPILARPVGSGERFVRWCRRKPALAGSLGALVFALVFGFAGVTWQWRNAQHHAESEARQRRLAEDAVLRLTYEKAETLFEQDRAAQALAHLARLLRQRPNDSTIAARIQSALTLRGFSLPVAQLQHGARIMTICFSPDGQRVLTASLDGVARMWDARTGRALFDLTHARNIRLGIFSPDGRFVLTGAYDHTACIWDAADGHRVGQPMTHQGTVMTANYSLNVERVVTGSQDGIARVWDAATGLPRSNPLVHSNGLEWVAFSPDASRIVTVTTNGIVQIWNVDSAQPDKEPLTIIAGKKAHHAVFSPDGGQVLVSHMRFFDAQTHEAKQRVVENEAEYYNSSAEFSPDQKRLVCGSLDFTARVWDWRTGSPKSAAMHHDNIVTCAGFSTDGQTVFTTSTDNTARLWTSDAQPRSEPLRHDTLVWEAQLNAGGSRLATRLWTSNAWLWEVRTRPPLVPTFSHRGPVLSVRFTRDGQRLLTTSEDSTAKLWDVHSGRLLFSIMHLSWVDHAEFNPVEDHILTASQDGAARIWDASNGQLVGAPLPHKSKVRWAEFSPDGSRVATASDDYTAQVWEARSGLAIGQTLKHGSWVVAIHFSPDGTRVVTSSLDGTARVWDATTGEAISPPLPHEEMVQNALFTPDGQHVITASRDRTARVWDACTGKLLLTIEHPDGVQRTTPHLTRDGRRVVTAAGNIARIWDVATGQPVTDPLLHKATVNTARFSPDGTCVVTGSNDKTARIWDARTGFPLSEPMMHGERVTSAEFSSDGRWVVTGSADHHARIWEVPTSAAPVPSWLPELAEAVGGLRFNAQNMLESVPTEQVLRLRQRLAALDGIDPWTVWAKWFCADTVDRPLWPSFRPAPK